MANFQYMGTVGGVSPESKTFNVAAGAAGSITAGNLFNIVNGYAVDVANGGGVSTGTKLFALATTTSTDTVGAAGTVEGVFCPSGLIVRGTATTPGNLSAATLFDKVTIDVSGDTQTVDENDVTNGAILIYNYPFSDYATTGIIDVVVPFQVP